MFNGHIWFIMDDAQREDFNEWVQWFFDTLETVDFQSGAHLPCDQWWEHPEALSRLVALWSSYKGVNLPEIDSEGDIDAEDKHPRTLSDWWKESVDYHKTVLFQGRTSPFYKCSGGAHRPDSVRTAPETLWNGASIARIPDDVFLLPAPVEQSKVATDEESEEQTD